jgi:hypothetical protein
MLILILSFGQAEFKNISKMILTLNIYHANPAVSKRRRYKKYDSGNIRSPSND